MKSVNAERGAVRCIAWLDRFDRPKDDEKANQSSFDNPARDHIWCVTRFWTALRKINHETESKTVECADEHCGPPSSGCGQGKSCKKRNQYASQCGRAEDLPFKWFPWLKKNARALQCAQHRSNKDYRDKIHHLGVDCNCFSITHSIYLWLIRSNELKLRRA